MIFPGWGLLSRDMVCWLSMQHWAFWTVLHLRNFVRLHLDPIFFCPPHSSGTWLNALEIIALAGTKDGMLLRQQGQEAVGDSGWINQMQILRNNLLTLSVSSNRMTSSQTPLKREGMGRGEASSDNLQSHQQLLSLLKEIRDTERVWIEDKKRQN